MAKKKRKPRPRTPEGKPTNGRKATRLTRIAVGGPHAHAESVRRANDAQRIVTRRNQAWTMHLAGATHKQIAEALKVSTYTAHTDVVTYRQQLIREGLLDADGLRARQQAGLSAILRQAYGKMVKGDLAAAKVMLDTYERAARLNGLDLKRQDAVPLEQVLALMRTMTTAFVEIVVDPELRRQFAAVIRRQIGPLAPVDIPVPTPETTREEP